MNCILRLLNIPFFFMRAISATVQQESLSSEGIFAISSGQKKFETTAPPRFRRNDNPLSRLGGQGSASSANAPP
jgi:hypothetical protein